MSASTLSRDELPQERGARGPARPFKLEEFLSEQVAAIAQRDASPIGRLEHVERELELLLSTSAPATWRRTRRALRTILLATRRELWAADRSTTADSPAKRPHQAHRRMIPAGRGVAP